MHLKILCNCDWYNVFVTNPLHNLTIIEIVYVSIYFENTCCHINYNTTESIVIVRNNNMSTMIMNLILYIKLCIVYKNNVFDVVNCVHASCNVSHTSPATHTANQYFDFLIVYRHTDMWKCNIVILQLEL